MISSVWEIPIMYAILFDSTSPKNNPAKILTQIVIIQNIGVLSMVVF